MGKFLFGAAASHLFRRSAKVQMQNLETAGVRKTTAVIEAKARKMYARFSGVQAKVIKKFWHEQ